MTGAAVCDSTATRCTPRVVVALLAAAFAVSSCADDTAGADDAADAGAPPDGDANAGDPADGEAPPDGAAGETNAPADDAPHSADASRDAAPVELDLSANEGSDDGLDASAEDAAPDVDVDTDGAARDAASGDIPSDSDADAAAQADVSSDAPPHLVLVHGYLGVGSNWDTAVDGLVDRGWQRRRIHAPSLGNTNDSIVELAARVDATVASILATEPDARIDIVGHSLGAAVVRWWVTQLGGLSRVDHVVTVAGANQGNDAACVTTWAGRSSRQLCPAYASEADSTDAIQWTLNGAAGIADVDQTPGGVEDGGAVRWTAIAHEGDLIIQPWQASCLDAVGRRDCSAPVNLVVDWPGAEHISLIRDARFIELLAERLAL